MSIEIDELLATYEKRVKVNWLYLVEIYLYQYCCIFATYKKPRITRSVEISGWFKFEKGKKNRILKLLFYAINQYVRNVCGLTVSR